jgi:hypothetical protein
MIEEINDSGNDS